MRTTITLDADVAARLAREVKRRDGRFKETVNDLLRAGLDAVARSAPARRRPFTVQPFDLGGSLVGSLDNVEEVLSRVEGESHR
jgi:hypothetical protein